MDNFIGIQKYRCLHRNVETWGFRLWKNALKKSSHGTLKKKICLSSPQARELFSFSGMAWFLAIFSSAAAFPPERTVRYGRVLLTFFCCRKKVRARPAWGHYEIILLGQYWVKKLFLRTKPVLIARSGRLQNLFFALYSKRWCRQLISPKPAGR